MRCAFTFFCGVLLLAAVAQAQTAPETVIVTGTRPHSGVTPSEIGHDFVRSFATPTTLLNAIARWQVPICPQFLGVAPNFAAVMEAHFRTIAGQVGAPMKEAGCKPNLSVVVTPQPQAYLDELHTRNVKALGYYGAVTITQPVQAWYVTGIQDIRGMVFLDDKDSELRMEGGPFCACTEPLHIATSNTAPIPSIGGWRFHPDLSSDLLYVTILVDAEKTGSYTVGEIADYVTMMALSRTEDYGDCQLMPSIANLLSPGCDDKLKPSQITLTDIAYLKGVYRMDARASLQVQQNEIAGEMAKALAGGK